MKYPLALAAFVAGSVSSAHAAVTPKDGKTGKLPYIRLELEQLPRSCDPQFGGGEEDFCGTDIYCGNFAEEKYRRALSDKYPSKQACLDAREPCPRLPWTPKTKNNDCLYKGPKFVTEAKCGTKFFCNSFDYHDWKQAYYFYYQSSDECYDDHEKPKRSA